MLRSSEAAPQLPHCSLIFEAASKRKHDSLTYKQSIGPIDGSYAKNPDEIWLEASTCLCIEVQVHSTVKTTALPCMLCSDMGA